LEGKWKKVFTTAADATFKPSGRRGNATVEQFVDARRGFFTNVIRFDGTRNKVQSESARAREREREREREHARERERKRERERERGRESAGGREKVCV